MEFGQIYGSYRRDFVPTEIGMVIYDVRTDVVTFRGKRFEYPGALVMRKNTVDELGTRMETVKRLIVPSTGEIKEFDPDYFVRGRARREKQAMAAPVYHSLADFFRSLRFIRGNVPLVFFGCAEDVNLLKRAGLRIERNLVIDLQKKLRDELKFVFSLDRAAVMMEFGSDLQFIASRRFRYRIPNNFRYLVKPHKAVGDAARIFLLYKEFTEYKEKLLEEARELLEKLNEEREEKEEKKEKKGKEWKSADATS